jgi:hypothetical protein
MKRACGPHWALRGPINQWGYPLSILNQRYQKKPGIKSCVGPPEAPSVFIPFPICRSSSK